MKPGFVVRTDRFLVEDSVKNGNRFLIGNGYFGYRGTLDEGAATDMVALNIAGLYDRQGSKWREPINAYNPFYTTLKVNSTLIHPNTIAPTEHTQGIDMECGTHFRESRFMIGTTVVKIASERFAVQAEKRLIVTKYSFSVSTSADLELCTGIDADVYDINGPHLAKPKGATHYDASYLTSRTLELAIPVVVAEVTVTDLTVTAKPVWEDNRFVRVFRFRAESGVTYSMIRFAAVTYGGENTASEAIELVRAAKKHGYRSIKAENAAWWKAKWTISDVRVRGAEEAQLGLRNSIYHLISIRPRDAFHSVPARGLSGQVYKGAIFWDTEMFMMPFYLNTDLEAARNCVMYRVHTLAGALRKAKQYGYLGAFYAWESQETGDDACSDFNVTDPVTKEPIRTFFKEQQIHITGDVVYAALNYLDRTKDLSVLAEGGLEMLLESVRFYLSYVKLDRRDGLYHVPCVIGPDEYHEGVNDNAYTNRLIHHTLQGAVRAVAAMRKKDNPFVTKLFAEKKYAGIVQKATRVAAKLYVPTPDEHGLIAQFQGYFHLEDATVDAVKARIQHENEYLGGPNGVVTPTQVIKQADVVTMLALFPEDYPDRIKKANWTYYEPRTEHGSSLSASMYALVAAAIGETEYGYPLFLKSAMIDILGEGKSYAGGIYIGGTHPAASGGAYLVAIYGFAGLRYAAGKIRLDTRLPKAITGLTFKIATGTRTATVEVTKNGGVIKWSD
ncbi:MAG TPA: glycoside hydrolase family 65 protein [Acholeplasmatales bacterium]|nr:glycoside hydrolase family 65 protein [Acholeplasmatales bacterium]